MVPTTTAPELIPMRVEKPTPCSRFTSVAVAGDLLTEMERGVAGALRVVLVGDRRPEERHDAVARELVDEAFETLDPVDRMRKKRCMICENASGSSCSASSIEPFTSANSTVTCLRSPSSADFDCRILSARCLAVWARGSDCAARGVVCGVPSGDAHWLQNFRAGRILGSALRAARLQRRSALVAESGVR